MNESLKENRKELKPMIVMFKAYQALIELIKKDIKNTGFAFNEFTVLEVIYHKKRITVTDIKEKVLVASSSLTYILDKLEKKGLIKRLKSEFDKRIIYVELTNDGVRISDEIFPKHYEVLKKVFNVLKEDEKNMLTDLIKKVGFNALKYGGLK